MNEVEFGRLIDGHIERTATRYGEMPANFFPGLLVERIHTKATETPARSGDTGVAEDPQSP